MWWPIAGPTRRQATIPLAIHDDRLTANFSWQHQLAQINIPPTPLPGRGSGNLDPANVIRSRSPLAVDVRLYEFAVVIGPG